MCADEHDIKNHRRVVIDIWSVQHEIYGSISDKEENTWAAATGFLDNVLFKPLLDKSMVASAVSSDSWPSRSACNRPASVVGNASGSPVRHGDDNRKTMVFFVSSLWLFDDDRGVNG
jgi:hypothetical protein